MNQITVSTAAQKHNIESRIIHYWIRKGILPGVKRNGRWFIDPQDLEQFLSSGIFHQQIIRQISCKDRRTTFLSLLNWVDNLQRYPRQSTVKKMVHFPFSTVDIYGMIETRPYRGRSALSPQQPQ